MMNVVSNTRVDMVARGVIKGVIESGYKPSEKIAIFRIPGSWEGEGFSSSSTTASSTATARCRCTKPRAAPSRR